MTTTTMKKGSVRDQVCAITTSANLDDWRVVRTPGGRLRIVVLDLDGNQIGWYKPRDLVEYTKTLGKRNHGKLVKEIARRIVDIDEGRGVQLPIRNQTEETYWLLELVTLGYRPSSHRRVIFGPTNEFFL